MAMNSKTEDQIKDDIFKLYSQCKSETSSDRKPVLSSQLSENIFLWCKKYLLKEEAENMGVEIFKFSMRIIKEDSKANIPMEKTAFFKYLYSSLKREKAGYYRDNESGIINISKERKAKLRKAEDTIRMRECILGRGLTSDEHSQCINGWFKNHEYNKLVKYIHIGNLPESDKNSMISPYNDPSDIYLLEHDTKVVMEAIKSVLNKKQVRSRDCYKSLFTLFCFENDLKMLYPALDNEILKSCQEEQKKPKKYEIYQKYHPETKKDSAGVRSSDMLKDFLNDLKIYLKDS